MFNICVDLRKDILGVIRHVHKRYLLALANLNMNDINTHFYLLICFDFLRQVEFPRWEFGFPILATAFQYFVFSGG